MLTPNKPHIPNLKSRLTTAFAHAYDHCNIHYSTLDAGGEEGGYLLRSREFQAALGLLDQMVKDDRFTSHRSLNDCRNALVWYRRELQDGSYGIKSREIGDLVSEIDHVAETAFV
jgi:hypothetical protein